MKKNIKILQKQLRILNGLNTTPFNIESSSVLNYIKYKYRLQEIHKLEKAISKLDKQKQKILQLYETQIENWINDPKVSLKTYERLSRRATYSKDLKLYKLGYLSEKPLNVIENFIFQKFISPFSQKLKSFLYLIKTSKLKFDKKVESIAIDTTKKCIRGYRTLKNFESMTRKSFSQNPISKKLKYIKDEAISQLDSESSFIPKVVVDYSTVLKNYKMNSQNKKIITDKNISL